MPILEGSQVTERKEIQINPNFGAAKSACDQCASGSEGIFETREMFPLGFSLQMVFPVAKLQFDNSHWTLSSTVRNESGSRTDYNATSLRTDYNATGSRTGYNGRCPWI